MTTAFDILVAGDDEASLCAAAAAAQGGARTALLRPSNRQKRDPGASVIAVPNFVWRRLDLQDYGLILEPVSARVTLFAEHKFVQSCANPRRTQGSLAQADCADHLIWEAFADDMAAAGKASPLDALGAAATLNGAAMADVFRDPKRLSQFELEAQSCIDVLDDYLGDAKLKAHVAAHALARAGLGGLEAGSAAALSEFFSDDAWPARVANDSPPLSAVLEKACEKFGVSLFEGKLLAIDADAGKHRLVNATGEQTIRTQFVFFATPEAALAAGARPELSARGGGNAIAVVRLTLKEAVRPPAGDESALFQIADDFDDLQTARDASSDGRLPDRPPVEFEFTARGDIIARTAYCPAAFGEGDELRGWTGQDRQAIAARIKERLAARIDGLAGKIAKTEISIIGGGEPDRFARIRESENVIMQPRRHDAIAAAVKRIDETLRHV